MKIKAYYRESDGHTYIFSELENEWIAFPTFKTNEPDWLNPTLYSDINLNERDMAKLNQWLKKRK